MWNTQVIDAFRQGTVTSESEYDEFDRFEKILYRYTYQITGMILSRF